MLENNYLQVFANYWRTVITSTPPREKNKKLVNSSKCELNFWSEYVNKSDVTDGNDADDDGDDHIPMKKNAQDIS